MDKVLNQMKDLPPIIENINNDDSSIYLTSTQQIDLQPTQEDYTSYNENPPENINEYSGKQVIINSGRLVFNSSNDHILLNSNKTINLNSPVGVNIDTNIFSIQTNKIYLGSPQATEPLLLGNQTKSLLKELIKTVKSLSQVLGKSVGVPLGAPLEPIATTAKLQTKSLDKILSELETITSKDNFTI